MTEDATKATFADAANKIHTHYKFEEKNAMIKGHIKLKEIKQLETEICDNNKNKCAHSQIPRRKNTSSVLIKHVLDNFKFGRNTMK